ncbi:MAG: GNAT family N-acetyltransferase [Paracoccaceae bacterium]|nr:GNAT family N-acetyltransferase [Paracoccaceae bacterium]
MTRLEERSETDLRLAKSLSQVHAAAFAGQGRAWSGPEILALISEPRVSLLLAYSEAEDGVLAPACFALYRVAAGEAELLTLAVAPDARRHGLGRGLVRGFINRAASDGARRLFLQVGAGNAPALGLYTQSGFRECGRRPGYYLRPNGDREDAVAMELTLAAADPPE